MKPFKNVSDTIGARGGRGSGSGGGTANKVITMQPYGHAGRNLSPTAAQKLVKLQKKHNIPNSGMKYMIESVNRSKK